MTPVEAATATGEGGERFAFGRNWQRFVEQLDEHRIAEAERSLTARLGEGGLEGKSFLDAGSGSGLFSLAAHRLGARVHSFDYDPRSVACTAELRRRFGGEGAADGAGTWSVERGDVLDAAYRRGLGTFDVVYSWGVLHHTGRLWEALEGAGELVAPEGLLFVAIYNHQPFFTAYWKGVKRLYNRLPRPLAWLMAGGYFAAMAGPLALADVARRRSPLERYRGTRRRGMSPWHDAVDWIGGWPFEAATPEAVFRLYRDRGFELRDLTTCGGRHGCNEFLLRRRPAEP